MQQHQQAGTKPYMEKASVTLGTVPGARLLYQLLVSLPYLDLLPLFEIIDIEGGIRERYRGHLRDID